jgi:hypothetical protein
MKKTAISIAMLGILCSSQVILASEIHTHLQSSYTAGMPLTKVLEKLSKTTKTQFFYSVSDLQDILVDDKKIDYKSLRQTLSYLQKNYPIEFNVQNNIVSARRTADRKIVMNDVMSKTYAPKTDTIHEKEKKDR